MTHSHDRTLLASLAFADPDKRDPVHDLACEYLAGQPEKLAHLITKASVLGADAHVEVAISKGEGQYRSTIGFLDVRVDWSVDLDPDSEKGKLEQGSLIIEVKINPVTVGDVIRQINLYREYVLPIQSDFSERLRSKNSPAYRPVVPRLNWALFTVFQPGPGELDALRRESIFHYRLGEEFAKWFEERLKRPPVKSEEF